MHEPHSPAHRADSWPGACTAADPRYHLQIRKPFTEYTREDWDAYNKWAADRLRSAAADAEAQGRFGPDVLQKWRDAAAWHDSQIGKPPPVPGPASTPN